MDVWAYYRQALDERGFAADEAQERAVARLQQAYEDWLEFEEQRSSFFRRLLQRPQVPRGVYMWGGVGRGKSFLMDSFYSVAPVTRKTRVHFHEFMRHVHRQLDGLKGMADPLQEVARRTAEQYRLICFDEFHVSDIADAMILYNLLKGLFENGVSFIMTSNYHPDDLYPDGLHRDRLLPAIALIKERMDVLNVDAGIDYRRRALEQVEVYHTPLGPEADRALAAAFDRIAETRDEATVIDVEGRQLRSVRRAGGIIWFSFDVLCGGPRSQNDYLELASRFHTVIVSDIPVMTVAMQSEARRFTWLIDVFYDHRIKMIMSAETPPEKLYMVGPMSQEFQRTVSRIMEMQSRDYVDAPRRDTSAANMDISTGSEQET
jgi:cell division protein ZapE